MAGTFVGVELSDHIFAGSTSIVAELSNCPNMHFHIHIFYPSWLASNRPRVWINSIAVRNHDFSSTTKPISTTRIRVCGAFQCE